MSSDKRIIRNIKRGDSKSFEELFEKYYDRFFSFAHALLGDPDAAEDILQNVFLKLWIGRERLDEDRSIVNYLLVCVRNEIFDYLRLKYNQIVVHGISAEQEDLSSDIEAGIELTELAGTIDTVIRQMPPQRQRVFMMSRYERMSAKEIAQAIGISERTVERHIYLALNDLKHIIS